VLVNELHGVVQFDVVGVSLCDEGSNTFRNYFIDMASRSEPIREEQLASQETLTLRVYERQEPVLRSGDEMEQLLAPRSDEPLPFFYLKTSQ